MSQIKTMNVSLTRELDSAVQAFLERGLFANQSEVIRAGLRLLIQQDQEHQARIESLRSEIHKGVDAALEGSVIDFDASEIKRLGRQRTKAKQPRYIAEP